MTEMRKYAVNGIECRVESLDSVELSIRITVDAGYSIAYARRREKRVSVGRQKRAGRRGGGGRGRREGEISRLCEYLRAQWDPNVSCSHHPLVQRAAWSLGAPPPRNKQ